MAGRPRENRLIKIEITGTVVHAERGIDFGFLTDVLLIATKPVDFRKGADGLAALVRETLGDDPFSDAIYVFRSKRADHVEMPAWDGIPD
jgi:hypothetical protein